MNSSDGNVQLEQWRLLEALRDALRQPTFRFELAKVLFDHMVAMLPVEPVFDLRTAAQLIPCTYRALQEHLKVHRRAWPRRYRVVGRERRRYRMLYAHEVAQIRRHYLRGEL